jgi:hypothetical protein
MRRRNRWLRFGVTTGAAVAIWALAATHGLGWQMLWLPAVIAGAAWPLNNQRKRRPLGGHRDSCL